LEEFDSIDPAFRTWLLAKRQAMRDRFLQHFEPALKNRSRFSLCGGGARDPQSGPHT
jgi:hypothetical protein